MINWGFGAASRQPALIVATILLGFGVLFGASTASAQQLPPPKSGPCVTQNGDLPSQDGSQGTQAFVVGDVTGQTKTVTCRVKPNSKYYYGQINIVAGGQLIFDEADGPGNIDLWSNAIIIENGGALIARNSSSSAQPGYRFGFNGSVLTFHLWGANASVWDETQQKFSAQNRGALCATQRLSGAAPCGVPTTVWNDNGKENKYFGCGIGKGPSPSKPNCIPGLDTAVSDWFYQYGPLYGDGDTTNGVGYFGNKVLAVSYGGTLQLSGYKGTSEEAPASDPTNSGYSWMRLNDGPSLAKGAPQLTLEADPNAKKLWVPGDEIVVTTTDYLPGHSEKLEIGSIVSSTVNKAPVSTITFSPSPKNPCPKKDGKEQPSPLCSVATIHWPHNGASYGGPNDKDHTRLSTRLQPRLRMGDPHAVPPRPPMDTDLVTNGAETRAAVALLSRSIRIVSEGDTLGATFPAPGVAARCPYDASGANCQYTYGGHMVIRQGFQSVQISGVEFKQMGQGGRLGHYPVHFHMARQTPANTYIADSSVNESMTRWYVIHSTLGVTLARNVGFMSIGHGYYLEMGPETDNKFYSNIGILARSAVQNAQNPRNVPGILADNQNLTPENPGVPYRSDNENPAVFWITNGWNDFIGNMAAGATTCGAGYWLVPAGNLDRADIGGAAMQWTGYAALQQNLVYAGTAPLKSFYKNSATSSMHSFQTTDGAVGPCSDVGVVPASSSATKLPVLKAVKSISPKPVRSNPGAAPSPQDNFADPFYPHISGGAHRETHCPPDGSGGYNCSPVPPPCAAENPLNLATCGVAVLDHYTSSFHWAPGNASAIWLRPQWYLMDNSFLSDVQNGGLTMVTGGDYTHSSAINGYWGLARNSIFVGNTQDNQKYFYASNIGPFNANSLADSKLQCDPQTSADVPPYCLSSAQGISMPVGGFFTNQRLNNIYDGPSYEDTSAYLDIKTADCAQGGYNGGCMYGTNQSYLLLRKTPKVTTSGCYLPNAAIAWKQPNGFYYPPAFHSANLQFDNVDNRHFVIEPLFQAPAGVTGDMDFNQGGTYLTKQTAQSATDSGVQDQYCTSAGAIFDTFTSIDRQTELNDDDGSLTGLVNSELATISPNPPNPLRQTISVNEDNYFEAPVETAECASAANGATGDNNTAPKNACNAQYPMTSLPPPTVKTSPYDYVSTVVWHTVPLVSETNPSPPPPTRMVPDPTDYWTNNCSTPQCYGVPLYRQYLTGVKGTTSTSTREWWHWYHNGCDQDWTTPQCRWPFVRMAGIVAPQRTTMTINNGLYYLDTTVPYSTQQTENFTKYPAGARFYNEFQKNRTYTVFLVYAKATTKLTYQIYVGPGTSFAASNFSAARVKIPLFPLNPINDPSGTGKWATATAPDANGIITVTLDLSKANGDLTPTPAQGICQPRDFCIASGSSCISNLQANDPRLLANKSLAAEADYICKSWAMKDLDCPEAGCYGFSFTLPKEFVADGKVRRPAPGLFPAKAPDQGAPNWGATFVNTETPPDSKSGGGKCSYATLPNCGAPPAGGQ